MIDPPPGTPMPHMTYWWNKYRATSGLLTEGVAPNRQRIFAACFSVFKPYKLKRAAQVAAGPAFIVAGYEGLTTFGRHINYLENKTHWD